MGKAQSRECFVFIREIGKLGDDIDQLATDELQAFRHDDQIRIISDITGCRAQMNDSLGFRTLNAIGVYEMCIRDRERTDGLGRILDTCFGTDNGICNLFYCLALSYYTCLLYTSRCV